MFNNHILKFETNKNATDEEFLGALEYQNIRFYCNYLKIKSGNCVKTLLGHTSSVWGIIILSNEQIASYCDDDITNIRYIWGRYICRPYLRNFKDFEAFK